MAGLERLILQGTQATDRRSIRASYHRAPFSWEVRFVLFALLYILLRRMVGLIAGSSSERMNTEVEIVVLRTS
jgi:hypothetical protein